MVTNLSEGDTRNIPCVYPPSDMSWIAMLLDKTDCTLNGLKELINDGRPSSLTWRCTCSLYFSSWCVWDVPYAASSVSKFRSVSNVQGETTTWWRLTTMLVSPRLTIMMGITLSSCCLRSVSSLWSTTSCVDAISCTLTAGACAMNSHQGNLLTHLLSVVQQQKVVV